MNMQSDRRGFGSGSVWVACRPALGRHAHAKPRACHPRNSNGPTDPLPGLQLSGTHAGDCVRPWVRDVAVVMGAFGGPHLLVCGLLSEGEADSDGCELNNSHMLAQALVAFGDQRAGQLA